MRRTGWTNAAAATALAAMVVSCSAAGGIAGHSQPPSQTTPGQGSPGSGLTPTSPSFSGGLPAGFGPGPTGQGLARFYDQQVNWTDCGGGDTCASIWVPLNYAKPDGQAITIKAKMQPATDQAHKVGTLFINPGGPGGSGIDYLGYIDLDAPVTRAYDVVGFDPRGVGSSTPVSCVSDHEMDLINAADPSPDTPAEIAQMQRLWTTFTRGCQANSGPLLAHVSTIEAARDMDILRAVVKDPTFNFFGASYGTYLGATYAALFPAKVNRMVLDGAVDPMEDPLSAEEGQAAGFQAALSAYLTACVNGGNCVLGDSVDAVQQQIVELLQKIDQHPLPTAAGRPVTEGLALLGMIVPLYNSANWSLETQALEQALEGHGDALLYLSDQYTSRQAGGHYSNNSLEVQPAVNCLDHPQHETLTQIEGGEAGFDRLSPVFGPAATWWPYACSNWPVHPTLPNPDYSAPGAKPIVVVGTTRDPATPYQQAINLASELDSGVLLSRNGDGHTAYGRGNSCIDDAIDTYLVTGNPPASGKLC